MRLIIIAIIINISPLFAQNIISGKVVDQNAEPLPFTNIVLYESETGKTIKGTIGDDKGKYILENIPIGSYWLEVSMIGFESKKTEPFSLSENKKSVKLNFTLDQKVQMLNGVIIQSKRPKIRRTAGKLIIDIENSVISNLDLAGVLKKVPGILIINGSLTYAGQQGVTIFIDGKSTDYMDTSTLLNALPTENIAKIELIQQPGAEFPAEGTGPIINIVLKENTTLGTHGNVKTNVGYDNEVYYGTSAAISSYKNKLNWQVSAGSRKTAWRDELYISRKVKDQVYDQATISPYDPRTSRLSGSLDYYLNKNNTIGVGASWLHSDSDRITSNETLIREINSSSRLTTESSFDKNRVTFNIDAYYQYEDEKNKVSADFNYVDYDKNNQNNLYKISQSPLEFNDRRYNQDGKYNISTYRINYVRTFSDNLKFLSGIKYDIIETDSDLRSFERNDTEFILNSDQSDRFLVNERIWAMYSQFSGKVADWAFSAGLRWEYSDTRGTSVSSAETKTRYISKVFPSASVSKSITETLGANLSYSYRINRPSYNSLNSFVYYYDPYTFERGNPNLEPAFTNNVQFNLTFDEQPFFSIGYRNTSDALFEIITQNDETAKTSRTVINLAKNTNWNFRAFAPINFLEGLNGYTGLIANYVTYQSTYLSPELDLSKWSITWSTNIEYQLPWDIHSELTGYYSSGGYMGLIEYDWMAGLSYGVSKNFMDDKLNVNLGVKNMLNRKFFGTVQYNNINANIINDWSRQDVYLQLTYNFGSEFNKEKDRDNISQEVQDRIENNN